MPRKLYTEVESIVGLGENIAEVIFGRRRKVVINRDKYPIIPLYKYMKSSDIHFLEEEQTIKLSGLATYAQQDAVAGVGDPRELHWGELSAIVADAGHASASKVVANLAALGIALSPDEHGRYPINTTTIYTPPPTPNRFIQCLAFEFSEDDLQKWGQTPDAEYDSCVKINDAIKFCRLIQNADSKGRRFLGGHAIIDKVVYHNFPIQLDEIDCTYFQYIKERSSFQWQKEVRISWPRVLKQDEPDYILHVPGVSELVERL